MLVQDHKIYTFFVLLFERVEIGTIKNTQHCLLYVLFMGFSHLDSSFNSFPVSTEPCATNSLVEKPPCKSSLNNK